MADPNSDLFHDTQYSEEFMEIINAAINVTSLELWDTNPFSGETGNKIETNLGGNEIPEPVPLQLPTNDDFPIDIDSLLVDPSENKLGNEIPEPVSLKLPTSDEPLDIDSLLGDQTEMNLGNEFHVPFSFPSLEAIVEYNGETSNQGKINPGFECYCCEILREIVHFDGGIVTKLQLHGKLVGVLFHAVLDVSQSNQVVSREVFNFRGKSLLEVKQFLREYCMKREQEGCTMLKDPRSSFFEALCIGFDWYENPTTKTNLGDIPNNLGQASVSSTEQVVATTTNDVGNNNNDNNQKSSISLTEQRKRIKEMRLIDLANYLHLPRKEAAQKLGLSETVVHNIWCKGNTGGKRRWPHRKIQSKVKELMKWRELLSSDDPQVRDRAGVEILLKQEELAQIYREGLSQYFF
ncbi:hypothetical protein ES288_A08G293000v1 [Gossypium darwinii]|uniref:RWP-RK domain-containing protein n=1 Tax=Gossypium darwinii TaxID=34276 RepID=A0A5D2FQE2_GOSDA|nr:hypothetical protein ES288_A08G293000v1 [Gossypium darwinii]